MDKLMIEGLLTHRRYALYPKARRICPIGQCSTLKEETGRRRKGAIT